MTRRGRDGVDDIADEPQYQLPSGGDAGVWDEPSIGRAAPADADTYGRRLSERAAATSRLRSWLATIGIAAAAGPWASVTAFWGSTGFGGWVGLLGAVLVAPPVEEMAKIAILLTLVETRPHLFRGRGQIVLCGLLGGAAFAAIENLIYLNVYVPHPSPTLATFRWTVCTALHVTASTVSSVGVGEVWSDAFRNRRRPSLALATPWLIAAMVLHALYNGTVTVLAMNGVSP